MEEKKYLKWYNKIGYGSGDIAGNVVYAFLTSFMMVYLTDSVGLAAGVVGTLIAVSKLFDGFTDIFFGSMIDKTHSKMGKAKPWMLYGYIGCAITLIGCFAVPVSLGTTAKYAWFFISYTLLNSVFYTANNIAYSALTSLITKNSKERVQMGSYRFIFAFSTSLLIQAITVGFVDKCGGDAAAWRTVAIIYAIIGLVINTISALSVKELPEEELNEGEVKNDNEKYGMVQAFKLLVKNKYYMMASCSEYTYLTQGKRIDGTMYSCTSLGVKIGGGIGTAVVGWMLEFSGYVGTNATQPQSALDMMQFMYLWLPLIFDVLIMFVLSRMNVEDANKKLKAEKGIAADEVTDASDIN
ncbi:hypothetical protein GPK60_00750 [Ruminococcus sp. MCC718]|uniref:MFS transporter n=1 Tax=Ruminococcus sp. MCC718 TaxID=2592649 RepID=UPI001C015646|nr:MFS transporter [Ruminococcus sp. MCC718]MBT9651609.1 hypothetical protein [Ruminococcus sp. MCC718]